MDYFEKYKEFLPVLKIEERELIKEFFAMLKSEAMPYGFIGKTDSLEELWLRHIADSLLVLQDNHSSNIFNEFKGNFYDIGSGAGLPGILYSILYPGANIFLVDSSMKRTTFMEKVCSKLSLSNTKVLCSPVEKLNTIDNPADIITFRAFRKPLAALELILTISNSKSKILYWRSRPFENPRDDDTSADKNRTTKVDIMNRVSDLGYSIVKFETLNSPSELGPRGYYLFDYTGETKKGFPRSWARIKKDQIVEGVI